MAMSLSQTPAPSKDRIYGSKVNPKGSASSEKSAEQIKLSTSIIVSLTKKLNEFKETHKTNKVSLSDLKAVYRRGLGAYSTSHRPNIPRPAWAMGRVNAFLSKAGGTKVKKAYVQDDDLMKYEDGGEVDYGEIYVLENELKSGSKLLEAYMVVNKNNPFVLQFKDRAIYCLKFSKNKDGKWHFYNVAVGFTKEEFKEIKEKSLKPTLQNTSIIIGAEKKILYELMKYEIDYLISKGFVVSPLFVDKYGVTYSVDKLDDDFYTINESFVKRGKSVENNNSLDIYATLGGDVFKAINNLYKKAKEEKEMANGGDVGQEIRCRRCGWNWNTKDSFIV